MTFEFNQEDLFSTDRETYFTDKINLIISVWLHPIPMQNSSSGYERSSLNYQSRTLSDRVQLK